MKGIIKVCGITTFRDAEDAVTAGANALGFNFYPKSPRFVSLERARDISLSLPHGMLKVGVFVNESLEELAIAQRLVPLDVLQLHGLVPDPPPAARIWRSVPIDEHFRFTSLNSSYEAYLLDAPSSDFGGSGQAFDWSLATTRDRPADLIVAGGLDAANVAAAIAAIHPSGVDACSRLESSPGRKDPQKVKAFVEAARAAFERLRAKELPPDH
jgi:phosphoribosylanthranilate isomerase